MFARSMWGQRAMRSMMFAVLFAAGGCEAEKVFDPAMAVRFGQTSTADATPPSDEPHVQATSLLGKPLIVPALADEVRAKRERELEAAQFEYDRDPHNEEAIIWLGRRQAYLGRYDEAINTFSNGLAIHPDSYKLLRHRGHRYITLRKFDLAKADLSRAADLIDAVPDEVEPDGQPNKQNIPTSTTHTNIFYHLGLVCYLRGEYADAFIPYEQCLRYSTNDDMRVAALYWKYLNLRRLNRNEQARDVLDAVSSQMKVIENTTYHRLLLMFKGELTPDDLAKPSDDNQPPDIDAATAGYGIGMFHLLRGEEENAMANFRKVIDTTNWAAFGHIAAEVELARAASAPSSSNAPD